MRNNQFLSLAIILVMAVCLGCSPNNVTKNTRWGKHFKNANVQGTFAIYDNAQGNFEIYDVDRYRDSAYLPASTFKIVNAIIGLKTGKIVNEQMVIKWDGKVRTFSNGDTIAAWNKDLTMQEAFKASAVPYFQEVARNIGKDTMQRWLDSLQYGNKKISTIDTFWLDNTLKITPDEQLGLVKRLYFELLPIDKRPQRIVKALMEQEKNANYTLAYKTGWGTLPNGKELGWLIGWIEENKHPYFFVLNIEGNKGTDMVPIRKKIVTDILTEEGFFKGKK